MGILDLDGGAFADSPTIHGAVTAKIIGGETASDGAYPWMVALIHRSHESVAEGQFCGGILIDSNWVLTAAHCIRDRDPAEFLIAIGDENLNDQPRLVAAQSILANPASYDRTTRGGDLALVQLAEPVTHITPIRFRRMSDPHPLPSTGRILGWGRTNTTSDSSTRVEILQQADVPIHRLGDAIYLEFGHTDILPEYILTGQIDPDIGAFHGDSGGPLMVRDPSDGAWTVVGIDSWGGGSAETASLSMYTDIATFSDWIDAHLPKAPTNEPTDLASCFDGSEPMECEPDGHPLIGVWPFAPGPSRSLEISADLKKWTSWSFAMIRPDEFRFNENGSVTPLTRHFYPDAESIFFRETEIQNEVVRTGVFPLYPHQLVRGFDHQATAHFGQHQAVFKLEDIEVGRDYAIAVSNPSRTPIHLTVQSVSDGKFNTLKIGRMDYHAPPYRFNCRDGLEYWVTIGGVFFSSPAYQLFVREVRSKPITDSAWRYGRLEPGDSPLRRSGTLMDVYTIELPGAGREIEVQLDAVFDAEMGVYDRTTGDLLAYYDQGAEGDLETMILGTTGIEDADLRIFNFDSGFYGDYRLRIVNSSNENSIEVGLEQQRALTSFDYQLTDPDATYEWIDIDGTDPFSSLIVEVRGFNDFVPFVGVYDINDRNYLEQESGPQVRLTFTPVQYHHYSILVAANDGIPNRNYSLKVTGTESPPIDDSIP